LNNSNLVLTVTNEHIETILKGQGLKITKTRFFTLKSLYELNHPSVEDIIKFLFQSNIKTTFQSVYNTLETFEQLTIIKKVATNGGCMRYDIHLHNHCHIHIDETNEVNDYNDKELMLLIENHFKKKNPEGYNIKSIDVVINAKQI
jgi:Fe2+ or Zn2+ uptake regulation protein